MNAETHARITQDHITVHRIDIVDAKGPIRMTLAASAPLGRMDGVEYKRIFDASGIVLYDAKGNERGGVAIGDIPGSAIVVASDHENYDAIGWRVMPDGSISFGMNQKPPVVRDAALGNHVVPGQNAKRRISLDIAADGTPTISLADKDDHPRLRLLVTPDGYGAIEFVAADGRVVQTIAPEGKALAQPHAN